MGSPLCPPAFEPREETNVDVVTGAGEGAEARLGMGCDPGSPYPTSGFLYSIGSQWCSLEEETLSGIKRDLLGSKEGAEVEEQEEVGAGAKKVAETEVGEGAVSVAATEVGVGAEV